MIFVVAHTGATLIPQILSHVEHLWEKALFWQGDDLNELKGIIGELHYRMSHAMPYSRGSAAITEWLTAGLYAQHGFRPRLMKWKSIDENAMGNFNPIEFKKLYIDHIELRP